MKIAQRLVRDRRTLRVLLMSAARAGVIIAATVLGSPDTLARQDSTPPASPASEPSDPPAVAPAIDLPESAPPSPEPSASDSSSAPSEKPAQSERPALAAIPDDPRIDSVTGQARATWQPSVEFDHRHMKLELDFPTLDEPKLVGRSTLTVVPMGKPRSGIRLDSKGPTVREVRVGGRKAEFDQRDRKVWIEFGEARPVGQAFDVVIEYDLDYGSNRGQGLTWSRPIEGAEVESDRFPQVHSQGQAQDNSRWFPCHDFPNEKLTTELIVTVEDGFEVLSNGRLLSKVDVRETRRESVGRVRWHWLQDKPHPNYLVTLVIGKFSIVELGGAESDRPGLPIPVYTPIGTEETARRLYENTPAMIAFFERIFDEPYPWDQYAQAICRDFVWGGMENTSASTMTRGSLIGDPGSQDDLIAHELAHQWFGDLVTCRGWEHLWLNEGWASYSEALWNEHQAGDDARARKTAYQRTVRGFLTSQRARNTSSAPEFPAMVSNRFLAEGDVMMKPDDVYAKGAFVLHMLRMRLGDEAFFSGTRLFLDRFKFKHATTDDFRQCLEEVSGQSLDRFFTQWVMRPGMARLDVELEFVPTSGSSEGGELLVGLKQTQRVDADNPAYAFTLPARVKYPDGSGEYVYIEMDTRETTARLAVRMRPASVVIDSNLTVMAAHRVVKDLPEMQVEDSMQEPAEAPEPAAAPEPAVDLPSGS
jgi:aminopeptidase N